MWVTGEPGSIFTDKKVAIDLVAQLTRQPQEVEASSLTVELG